MNHHSLFRFGSGETPKLRVWNRAFALAGTTVLILTLTGGSLTFARAETPGGLREAIEHGDAAGVERLLANVPVDQHAATDAYALIWSAYYGRTDLLNDLLKRGVPATASDARGWTALLAAVKGDQPESAAILVAHGADPEARPKDGGASATTLATELGRTAVLARLHGAGSAAPKATAETFAAAVQDGRLDLVKELLADRSFRVAGPSAQAALLLAIRQKDTATALALLERGASANDSAVIRKDTPLVAAAATGNLDLVRALRERGPGPAAPGMMRDAALSVALSAHAEDVALFLARDAAAHPPLSNKFFLFTAIDKQMPAVIAPLLAAGADVNGTDGDGRTPLMCALRSCREAVDPLLAAHPRLDLRDHDGKTVFDQPDGPWFADKIRHAGGAAQVDAIRAAPRLDPAGLSEALLAAVKRNDPAAVRTLLDQGAKPQTCNRLGWPASVLAASKGYTEVLRRLSERDGNVLSQVSPDGFWGPFMEAAGNGYMETVDFLLAHPRLADVTPGKIRTALDKVDQRGYQEMGQKLRDVLSKLPPEMSDGEPLKNPAAP